MPHYILELSYAGSGFFGWQSQPHRNTVQDRLEAALASVLGAPTRATGASRTDTGVHAAQQFALFVADAALDGPHADAFCKAVQNALPPAIQVRRLARVPASHHPTRSAVQKRYCYRIRRCARRDASTDPRRWSVRKDINCAVLEAELKTLVGTHDFTSFCAADSSAVGKVRTLAAAQVVAQDDQIEVWFEGRGFLKQMLRIIVGSAVDCASGRPGAPTLTEILAQRDRRFAGRAAPAQGLTLESIALRIPQPWPQGEVVADGT